MVIPAAMPAQVKSPGRLATPSWQVMYQDPVQVQEYILRHSQKQSPE